MFKALDKKLDQLSEALEDAVGLNGNASRQQYRRSQTNPTPQIVTLTRPQQVVCAPDGKILAVQPPQVVQANTVCLCQGACMCGLRRLQQQQPVVQQQVVYAHAAPPPSYAQSMPQQPQFAPVTKPT
jgi:hypothetical protein